MLKSIMGKVLDCRVDNKRARVLPASGWRSTKAAPRFTGVHRQLNKADMAALVLKLQRQAS